MFFMLHYLLGREEVGLTRDVSRETKHVPKDRANIIANRQTFLHCERFPIWLENYKNRDS